MERQYREIKKARRDKTVIVRNFNDPEVLETTYIAHRGAVARMVLTSQFMKAIEFLAYAILPAGNTIEEHIDPVEEIYLIFKGGGVMKVGNETREVGEGDAVWIPVGEPHSLENTKDGETFVLVVAAYP
jgi:mannose-6-phosphate isomerase-like protein (cupin superfamily)